MTNTDPIEPQASDPLDSELELLVNKISASVGGFGTFKGEYYDGISESEGLQQLLALIAQREQAAELRGRIDENSRYFEMLKTGEWRSFGTEVTERLATLQATKPEKEE